MTPIPIGAGCTVRTDHVVIERHTHRWDDSKSYSAYCTRCHRGVRGQDRLGNHSWATKSVAIKHAQAHADEHRARDEEARWNSWDIVGEVF